MSCVLWVVSMIGVVSNGKVEIRFSSYMRFSSFEACHAVATPLAHSEEAGLTAELDTRRAYISAIQTVPDQADNSIYGWIGTSDSHLCTT